MPAVVNEALDGISVPILGNDFMYERNDFEKPKKDIILQIEDHSKEN